MKCLNCQTKISADTWRTDTECTKCDIEFDFKPNLVKILIANDVFNIEDLARVYFHHIHPKTKVFRHTYYLDIGHSKFSLIKIIDSNNSLEIFSGDIADVTFAEIVNVKNKMDKISNFL